MKPGREGTRHFPEVDSPSLLTSENADLVPTSSSPLLLAATKDASSSAKKDDDMEGGGTALEEGEASGGGGVAAGGGGGEEEEGDNEVMQIAPEVQVRGMPKNDKSFFDVLLVVVV